MIAREEVLTTSLQDSVREYDCRTSRAGLLLKEQKGLTLRNLYIITQGDFPVQEAGIYLHESQDILIENCTIIVHGSGCGITVRGGRNITIRNCLVIMPLKKDIDLRTMGIQVTGTLPGVQKDHWKRTGTTLAAPNSPTNVRVESCVVFGGYYGLGCSSVDTLVSHQNSFLNNMRGISIQDSSRNCTVSSCLIKDNISAGIHFAYGSYSSSASQNTVESRRAEGEGFLQAYVGCRDITFQGNTLRATGEGPKYYLYTGVSSTGIQYLSNTIQGATRRAHVAADSWWDTRIKDPRHRSFHASTEDDGMAKGPVSVTFRGNTLPPQAVLVRTHTPQFPLTIQGDQLPFEDIKWQL